MGYKTIVRFILGNRWDINRGISLNLEGQERGLAGSQDSEEKSKQNVACRNRRKWHDSPGKCPSQVGQS